MESRWNPLDHPIILDLPNRQMLPTWIEHAPFAMYLIDILRPAVFLELGTHYGDSYCAFCQAVKKLELNTRCFAVDTWAGDSQAGHYGADVLKNLRQVHDAPYGSFSTLLQMTFDEARDRFPNSSIDLLHIDGCHTYDAVRHDFENYLPKMSPRGVVLIHDTNIRDNELFGVWRFWDEIKPHYPHFEFLHCAGLGIAAVGKECPAALRPLFEADAIQQEYIRTIFHRLGQPFSAKLRHATELVNLRTEVEQIAEVDRASIVQHTLQAELYAVRSRSSRGVQRFGAEMLLPIHQLAPGNDPGDWTARGAEPLFHLPCDLPPGWLHIELDLVTNCRGAAVTLQVDYGDGFKPEYEIPLGRNVGMGCTVSQYIRTHRAIRGLRLSPLDCPGEFTLRQFNIELVSKRAFIGRVIKSCWRRTVADGTLFMSLRKAAMLFIRGGRKALREQLLAKFGYTSAAVRGDYQCWIDLHGVTPALRDRLTREMQSMGKPPKISILMPVYNAPEHYLRRAIDSVVCQIYPHWELCIADDCSTASHIRPILLDYAARDKRIKLAWREENGNISAATNSALELATGEYIALLDQDDEITEHALCLMGQEIVADPDTDMLYSDEDKILPNGIRREPFFKPDWSPELLLAMNYICHLSVYRTSLVRQVGGFRSACDGAQDFDLVLRLSRLTQKIRHVPHILYHWRIDTGSTSQDRRAKPQAHAAGKRALEDYFAQRNLAASVEPGPLPTAYRSRFALAAQPKVSIIIPSTCKPVDINGRQESHVEHCINSIFEKSTYRNFEVIVLDRNEMDPDLEARLTKLGVRRITYSVSFNWSTVNNIGANNATGQHFLFLNDDMEVLTPDWLESMLEFSQQPDIGAVGAKLIFPNHTLQHVGVIFPGGRPDHCHYGAPETDPGYFLTAVVHRNAAAVTGACLMTRAEVFRSAGEFGVEFPLNYNDVDYCLRVLHTGKRIVYTPYAQLIHYESASRWHGVTHEEMRMFRSKWGHWRDPYYNPNFAPRFNDYRISAS